MITIEVYRQNNLLKRDQFPKGVIKIGRDKDKCNLTIDDPSISPLHLIIEEVGDSLILKDADSINGTFFENRRISILKTKSKEISLRLADKISIKINFTPSVDRKKISFRGDIQHKPFRKIQIILIIMVALLGILFILKKNTSLKNKKVPPLIEPKKIPVFEKVSINKDTFLILEEACNLYFKGELEEAAFKFRQVLDKHPNNQQAQIYLQQIKIQLKDSLERKFRSALLRGDYQESKKYLKIIEAIEGNTSPKVVEAQKMFENERKLDKAEALYLEGNYSMAQKILEGIEPLNQQKYQMLSFYIDTALEVEGKIKKAKKYLKSQDYKSVLDILKIDEDKINILPPSFKDEVSKLVRLASLGQELKTFYQKNSVEKFLETFHYFKDNFGQDNCVFTQYSQIASIYIQSLRKKFPKYKKEAIDKYNQALSLISEDKDSTKGYALLRSSLRSLKICLLINPQDKEILHKYNEGFNKFYKYLKNNFDKGYVLEGVGDYKSALRFYKKVIQLADKNSYFYKKAKKKIEIINKVENILKSKDKPL